MLVLVPSSTTIELCERERVPVSDIMHPVVQSKNKSKTLRKGNDTRDVHYLTIVAVCAICMLIFEDFIHAYSKASQVIKLG